MSTILMRAISLAGGKSALARKLGISRQNIQQWEVAPVKYVKKIAQATGGKVSEAALMREILDKRAA